MLVRSSSSSDLESEQSFQTSKSQKKKSPRRRGKSPMPWEADYKKLISCNLCNSVWSSRRALAVHNRSHELLRERYKNIFNQQCTVNLIKSDGRPNLTGLSSLVVHSSNKIIEPGNSYFCTIYSKEEEKTKCSSQESSDGEERIVLKPTQRKRRLVSRSSNETVVIESSSNKVLSDEEDCKSNVRNSIDITLDKDLCINIDDSSEGETEQSKLEKSGKVKQPMEAKLGDYKIIQGIISMCANSYRKKSESADVDMLYMNVNQNKTKDKDQVNNESQLKHKVLSIGRKIINKQGFNCTGLLRYMEHKSLEILWIAKAQSLNPKDTNYIRILTKLRGDLILDDESAWINVPETSQKKPLNPLKKSIKIAASNRSLSNVRVFSDSTVAKIATNTLANIETSQPEQINKPVELDSMPAMLSYLDSKASTSDSKKLLNANPVANPKQLPKKLAPGNESRSNKTVAQQSVVSELTEDDSHSYCLPIITSTTSLAAMPSEEKTQDVNQTNSITSEENNKTETPAPRIKVKPVSELMSESALDRMKEQSADVTNSNMFVSQIENVWPHHHPGNVYVPNIAPQMLGASQPLQILQIPTLNAETAYQPMPEPITSNTKAEYVILDTTDLPNTKTQSPIKYVKDLMQLHNIYLLDSESVPPEFICLIKFKVVFKQHDHESPVILSLSLSGFKNRINFQVRDRNQVFIDMKNISANWQWEILRTFQGEVCNKVLQNVQRFGQEIYELTNNFFCLIKSIKFCKL